ncbi:MAG: type II CAAX endopeptidase family protein [Planctomycetota bacterium]
MSDSQSQAAGGGTAAVPFPSIPQSLAIWCLVPLVALACFPLTGLQPIVGLETSTLIYHVAVFGLIFALAHLWRRRRLGTSRYRWRVRSWRVAVLVAIASVCLLFGLILPLTRFVPMPALMENAVQAVQTFTGPSTFLYLVIVTPILEELIFRGIILDGLLDRHRGWIAILVASLLSASMHLNPPQFIAGLMLGCLMGWVYKQTRSVGACIVIHMTANLSRFILRFFPDELDGMAMVEAWGGPFAFVAARGGLLLLCLVCLQLLRREFCVPSAAGEQGPREAPPRQPA